MGSENFIIYRKRQKYGTLRGFETAIEELGSVAGYIIYVYLLWGRPI